MFWAATCRCQPMKYDHINSAMGHAGARLNTTVEIMVDRGD
jgi:hypothetical protein